MVRCLAVKLLSKTYFARIWTINICLPFSLFYFWKMYLLESYFQKNSEKDPNDKKRIRNWFRMMIRSVFFEAQTRCLEKERKTGKKDKTERKNNLEKPPSQPWRSYAKEIISLLVGRRPETDSSWLGNDAGEYCGETGENCEAGVLSTCEPGETAEPGVLAWLPNILSKRRKAPRCLPLPWWRLSLRSPSCKTL